MKKNKIFLSFLCFLHYFILIASEQEKKNHKTQINHEKIRSFYLKLPNKTLTSSFQYYFTPENPKKNTVYFKTPKTDRDIIKLLDEANRELEENKNNSQIRINLNRKKRELLSLLLKHHISDLGSKIKLRTFSYFDPSSTSLYLDPVQSFKVSFKLKYKELSFKDFIKQKKYLEKYNSQKIMDLFDSMFIKVSSLQSSIHKFTKKHANFISFISDSKKSEFQNLSKAHPFLEDFFQLYEIFAKLKYDLQELKTKIEVEINSRIPNKVLPIKGLSTLHLNLEKA